MKELISSILSMLPSGLGIEPDKMRKLLRNIEGEYGSRISVYLASAFDFDEEDNLFYPHMDPGEAFLDALVSDPSVYSKG